MGKEVPGGGGGGSITDSQYLHFFPSPKYFVHKIFTSIFINDNLV